MPHQLFNIEELLHAIFFQVGFDARVDDDRIYGTTLTAGRAMHQDFKSLLACALTCQAFKEPALDELWCRQWGLGNLIKTMPPTVWTVSSRTTFPYHVLDFNRAPTATEWARFDYYARRIRWLDSLRLPHVENETSFCAVSPGIITQLRARARPVLPTLEIFNWTGFSMAVDPIEHFDLFLAPSLTQLHLQTRPGEIDDEDTDVDSDEMDVDETVDLAVLGPDDFDKLVGLASRCPTIYDLSIVSHCPTPSVKVQIPNIIVHMQRLESLELTLCDMSFSLDLLRAFGTLPALRSLTLGVQLMEEDLDGQPVYQDLPLADTHPALKPTILPMLEHLTLLAPTPTACAEFLSAVHLPRLVSFTASTRTTHLIRRIFEELTASCGPSSPLHTIDYHQDPSADPDADHIPVTVLDLKALARWPELACLRMSTPSLLLNDQGMAFVAQCWPHLRELRLVSGGEDVSAATMCGLERLLVGCPRLEELGLSLDVSEPAAFATRVRNANVETFELANSGWMDEYTEAADRLVACFPNLRELKTDRGMSDDWDMVADYISCSDEA